MSAPWALLSYLLRYPDEQADLAGEVAALPAGPVRESLERFLAAAPGPAHYVETFDLRRRNSLYLTYYAHGDTRERGIALLRLKKLYRAAGLPMESRERSSVPVKAGAGLPLGSSAEAGRPPWASSRLSSATCRNNAITSSDWKRTHPQSAA